MIYSQVLSRADRRIYDKRIPLILEYYSICISATFPLEKTHVKDLIRDSKKDLSSMLLRGLTFVRKSEKKLASSHVGWGKFFFPNLSSAKHEFKLIKQTTAIKFIAAIQFLFIQ